MNYHNFREYQLLEKAIPITDHLRESIKTEYLVVGGGVAGLHATQQLLKQGIAGKDIVIVEKAICGGGMSGKSGGFLTPDSELGLRALVNRYGEAIARKIRDFGSGGQASIVSNVENHDIRANLRKQDSLLLGLGSDGLEECKAEHEDRQEYGYDSQLIDNSKDLQKYNTGHNYTSGVRYTDCYGICGYQYCQGLKAFLESQGVRIFEFTEIEKLKQYEAKSNRGTITFKYCFLCPGKVTKNLSAKKAKLLFGVMNFITVSEPLTDEQIMGMMPNGDYMCWDTKLVFSYYRIIGGNRVILGGGNPVSSFLPWDIQYEATIKKTVEDFKHTFPSLKGAKFNEYRSGRIQVTRDFMPIIDNCNDYCNHTRVMGCAGLPRAAACGEFAVKKHFDCHDCDLDPVFSINRKRFIGRMPGNNIFKSIIFAISNAWAMFKQKGY